MILSRARDHQHPREAPRWLALRQLGKHDIFPRRFAVYPSGPPCSPVRARLAAHFTRERAARKIVPIVPYLQSHARRCEQRRSAVLRVDRTAYFRQRFHARESRASIESALSLQEAARFPCDSCVTRVRRRDARLSEPGEQKNAGWE